MGPFGREIARTLNQYDADLIVMDKDSNVISQMKSEGFKYAVHIDNLDPGSLAKFIKPGDIVVLALGDDFESNILTIEILKEIGVQSIYSRATKDIQYKVLEKMEITEILFPEKQEGRRFAMRLLNRDIHFIDEFAADIFLAEVPVTEKLVGRTITDLGIRSKYNVNIIGLRGNGEETQDENKQRMYYVGFENTVLKAEYSLLVIGKEQDLEELIKDTKQSGRNKD